MMASHIMIFNSTLRTKNKEYVIIYLYVNDMLMIDIYNDIVSRTMLFLGSNFEIWVVCRWSQMWMRNFLGSLEIIITSNEWISLMMIILN